MLKLLGGLQNLSNMLLRQENPLCNLGLHDDHHQGEFNKPLTFVKASTSTQKEAILKKEVPKMKMEKGSIRKPPQPRKHQLAIIVENMDTIRQDGIKGIKLTLVWVCGFQKDMFSKVDTLLHLC